MEVITQEQKQHILHLVLTLEEHTKETGVYQGMINGAEGYNNPQDIQELEDEEKRSKRYQQSAKKNLEAYLETITKEAHPLCNFCVDPECGGECEEDDFDDYSYCDGCGSTDGACRCCVNCDRAICGGCDGF